MNPHFDFRHVVWLLPVLGIIAIVAVVYVIRGMS